MGILYIYRFCLSRPFFALVTDSLRQPGGIIRKKRSTTESTEGTENEPLPMPTRALPLSLKPNNL